MRFHSLDESRRKLEGCDSCSGEEAGGCFSAEWLAFVMEKIRQMKRPHPQGIDTYVNPMPPGAVEPRSLWKGALVWETGIPRSIIDTWDGEPAP
jgi:hypothetical protein